MWTLIKFKNNKIKILKKELFLKFGKDLEIYIPKSRYKIFHKKNKFLLHERYLLGDYIFCYHKKFSNFHEVNKINSVPGVKYLLNNYSNNQKEMNSFIERCKQNSDDSGFIKQSFFEFVKSREYKFLSGPFSNFIFKVLDEQKNKFKISVENRKLVINKKHFFETLTV